MERITIKDLETTCKRLNKWIPGKDFSISQAYGGCNLVSNGGSCDVVSKSHISKKELYHLMLAFEDGMFAMKQYIIKQGA